MAFKRFKSILAAVLGLFLLLSTSVVRAQEHAEGPAAEGHEATAAHGEGEKKLDPAKNILDHIKDEHDIHFFTIYQ